MSMLFSPIRLGELELSNRLVVSPMCQYRAVDGVAQPWHLVHVGSYSISGAGLVIMEATAVEEVGRITRYCLGLYNDAQERALTDMVTQVRQVGNCALGIQLSHAGRKASRDRHWHRRHQVPPEEGGWETVGPSAVPFGPNWRVPHELDEEGLERVREAFVNSARRAVRCGFDVVEVHGAHGYLLSSFLSPLGNYRTDRYGGSLEARMRYPLEVIAAMRAVMPAGKALGVRINASELDERGTTLEDAVVIARELVGIGVDYVTLSAGNAVPGRPHPPLAPGYQVEYSNRVRAGSGALTMAVGMILEPTQAEEILQSGKADMIAIGRAFLDDPRWGWHAANRLDAGDKYPKPHVSARPEFWPGYAMLHTGGATNRVYSHLMPGAPADART